MESDLITLFFATILLIISCVVVYRWSITGKIDDVSGIFGAVGVFVAIVFIFSTGGGEILNEAGSGLTKTVEIIMRPVAVAAASWTGFMFGGTTGLTIALILTSPGLFPGVGLVKDLGNAGKGVWGTVTSVASSLNPFNWFKKKESAILPGNPFRDDPEGGRRRKLRR